MAAVLLLALGACESGPPPVATISPTPTPGGVFPVLLPLSKAPATATGQLLYISISQVLSFPLPSTETREVMSFPHGTYPGGLSAAPDGSWLAFSLYQPGTTPTELGGTDLVLVRPNGSDRRVFLKHSVAGEALLDPEWSSDSKSLYYTRWSPRGETQIERIGLSETTPTVVLRNAHNPTLSGGQMVYLVTDWQTRRELMFIAALDGSGARPFIDTTPFDLVARPTFSPDGKRLVFIAVGGPTVAQAPRPTGFGESPIAEAHGIPWELWMVNADGAGLTRLTDLMEDSPVPAWSPDGAWIGMGGEVGMYLLKPETKEIVRISDTPGVGGVAWVR